MAKLAYITNRYKKCYATSEITFADRNHTRALKFRGQTAAIKPIIQFGKSLKL